MKGGRGEGKRERGENREEMLGYEKLSPLLSLAHYESLIGQVHVPLVSRYGTLVLLKYEAN